MKKINSFVYNNLNLPKKVCNHIIGKEHSERHRSIAGVSMMIFGVLIANFPIINTVGIHILSETAGFLLHYIGAIPIIEIIEKKMKKNEQ